MIALWWMACSGPAPQDDVEVPTVTVPPIDELPDDTGGLRPDTGDTAVRPPINLVVNGDFEADDGWEARLGIVASFADAPERSGRALFVEDPGSDVSWSWSAPIPASEGDVFCLDADTYKTDTTNSGFPRVWVRFYASEEAGVPDAILLDPNLEMVDIDTSEQNRDAPEATWIPVRQTVEVPPGLGVAALRVILTANASATGRLWWDDVVLTGGACADGG